MSSRPKRKTPQTKKPARRRRVPPPASAAKADTNGARVTVRHYCQGIGDCHLLKFPKAGGGSYFVLIDCGVHSSVTGGSEKMRKIVDDIASVTKYIDVVVATHEHWDHVSGFFTSFEDFQRNEIKFGEAWMAWTENPTDSQGRQLDKFKTAAVAALQASGDSLTKAGALAPHLSAVRDGLTHVLGFHRGAKGQKVRDARDAILKLTKGRVKYLETKDAPIGLPGVDNLRVWILGPPRDAQLLGLTERASEMYGLAGRHASPLVDALTNALDARNSAKHAHDDYAMPFDPNYGTPFSSLFGRRAQATRVAAKRGARSREKKAAAEKLVTLVHEHYARSARPHRRGGDQSWRRIDNDWLGVSADLAIQLDSRTNNSSLVLAFEFIDTRRILLFVGDAQVGNWLSWQDLSWMLGEERITGPDLLKRTVYYKVGHHGSHNATLKAKGLELMTSSDFAAFIPTNANDALKVKWGAMPFTGIVDELRKHSHDAAKRGDRVIRADDPWIATDKVPSDFPVSGSIRELRHKPGLWVELDLA